MQAKGSLTDRVRARLDPFLSSVNELSRFQISVIAVLIFMMATGGVVAYLRAKPRPVAVFEAGEIGGEERARTLSVHVAGAVSSPGLYELPEGARVADALEEAGGVTPDAALESVNLAARVKDGEKVLVGRLVDSVPVDPSDDPGYAVVAPELININTATVSELEELPGVGPELAGRIIEYRKKNGPFSTVEELDRVDGIGPGKLESIRELATI